jgi:hypothetical protein
VQIANPRFRKEIYMNETIETPKKLEYSTPTLEQQPQFISITGASFPFGSVLGEEGDGE